MKNILWTVYFLFLTINAAAQVVLPVYTDSVFPTYYQQRVTHFRTLQQTKGDIIFLGNSITDGAEWDELLDNSHIKNRGISGDITAGVINRLDEVTNRKPAKVFLLIGINDLARNIAPDSVVKNILLIAAYIHQQTPATKLYVQSILPVNNVYKKFPTHTDKIAQINNVNAALQLNAAAHYYTYIDIHTPFCDESGKMRASLTNDGLHLKGEGYLLWKHLIYPYVFGLQPKPALLPLPRTLKWAGGYFEAYKCHTIVANEKLQNEKDFLKKELAAKGIQITNSDTGNHKVCIELHLEKVQAPQFAEEAYHLEVTSGKVIIR
ncbi:MAG TPA: GDSL-type esterase/lipase family protein, partial [Mucilaginibacter sp.]|nr:GDSL-type esterase/lipase family protein [Mucilaginibacter sp.]